MWAKGTTKVFMKAPQSVDLEIAREDSLLETALILQKYGRRYVMRCKYASWTKGLALLHEVIAKREEDALQKALDNTGELPEVNQIQYHPWSSPAWHAAVAWYRDGGCVGPPLRREATRPYRSSCCIATTEWRRGQATTQ